MHYKFNSLNNIYVIFCSHPLSFSGEMDKKKEEKKECNLHFVISHN